MSGNLIESSNEVMSVTLSFIHIRSGFRPGALVLSIPFIESFSLSLPLTVVVPIAIFFVIIYLLKELLIIFLSNYYSTINLGGFSVTQTVLLYVTFLYVLFDRKRRHSEEKDAWS